MTVQVRLLHLYIIMPYDYLFPQQAEGWIYLIFSPEGSCNLYARHFFWFSFSHYFVLDLLHIFFVSKCLFVCLFVCPYIFCLDVGTTVIKRNRWTVEPLNEIQFLKNKFYISILNGNLEFIDFIDYGYVQNYIFYFATIFHAILYGGMLGNFAEGSAPAHTV